MQKIHTSIFPCVCVCLPRYTHFLFTVYFYILPSSKRTATKLMRKPRHMDIVGPPLSWEGFYSFYATTGASFSSCKEKWFYIFSVMKEKKTHESDSDLKNVQIWFRRKYNSNITYDANMIHKCTGRHSSLTRSYILYEWNLI